MSTILILHGPSRYEVRKAFSLISHLEGKVPHKMLALAEMSVELKSTTVNLFSFLTDPLTGAGLLSFIPDNTGKQKISFTSFMFEVIDICDKVVLLPCAEVVYINSFVLSLGYALGNAKVIASLYYPGFELPHWYNKEVLKNAVDKRSELQKVLETI